MGVQELQGITRNYRDYGIIMGGSLGVDRSQEIQRNPGISKQYFHYWTSRTSFHPVADPSGPPQCIWSYLHYPSGHTLLGLCELKVCDSLRVSLDLMSLMFLFMGSLMCEFTCTYCEPIIPKP